ncbi:MAG: FAD-dependent oxidoreductase, partial [Acidimicrobiia bacterium]
MTGHTWGEEWDEVADIVVVGAGAAGGTAAATAVAEGASVIVVEKGPFPGGTTGKSGGQMWVPNNPLLRARGLVDDRADALRYMARTAYPVLYNPDHETLGLPADRYKVLEAFYDHGSEAVELLLEVGAATLESIPYADYYAHLPENTCPEGRTIAPILPPGWVPGRDTTGGQMLVDQLLEYATGAGAKVLVEHQVVRALRNTEGEVVGVETRVGLRTELIGARKGVIFTSGGFLHDERRVLEHLKGPVLGGAAA